jgi:hypothetical protein
LGVAETREQLLSSLSEDWRKLLDMWKLWIETWFQKVVGIKISGILCEQWREMNEYCPTRY